MVSGRNTFSVFDYSPESTRVWRNAVRLACDVSIRAYSHQAQVSDPSSRLLGEVSHRPLQKHGSQTNSAPCGQFLSIQIQLGKIRDVKVVGTGMGKVTQCYT